MCSTCRDQQCIVGQWVPTALKIYVHDGRAVQHLALDGGPFLLALQAHAAGRLAIRDAPAARQPASDIGLLCLLLLTGLHAVLHGKDPQHARHLPLWQQTPSRA